jgi:vacuolar-type H+-ATPase catalytic subunit A/Vma1
VFDRIEEVRVSKVGYDRDVRGPKSVAADRAKRARETLRALPRRLDELEAAASSCPPVVREEIEMFLEQARSIVALGDVDFAAELGSQTSAYRDQADDCSSQ